MPTKTKIVFSVSNFFVKKQRVLYEIELFVHKIIYINTKIKKDFCPIPDGIFGSLE